MNNPINNPSSKPIGRPVLLGDMLDPDTLFTTLPEPLRRRCRRAFIQGRNETLEAQARLGIAPPGSPTPSLPAFTGQAYNEDGTPTEAYSEHWKTFYSLPEVQQAQALARKRLGKK